MKLKTLAITLALVYLTQGKAKKKPAVDDDDVPEVEPPAEVENKSGNKQQVNNDEVEPEEEEVKPKQKKKPLKPVNPDKK
jgi:hypothetical protein